MPPIEWTVTLKKEPKYRDKTWKHDSYRTASVQGWALQDLHHCDVDTNTADRTIIVDATDYYNK